LSPSLSLSLLPSSSSLLSLPAIIYLFLDVTFLAHKFSLSLSLSLSLSFHQTPTHTNPHTPGDWVRVLQPFLSNQDGCMTGIQSEGIFFATGWTSSVRRDITVTSSQFVRNVEKRCTTMFVPSVLILDCSHDLPAGQHTSRTARSSLRFLCGFAIKMRPFPHLPCR